MPDGPAPKSPAVRRATLPHSLSDVTPAMVTCDDDPQLLAEAIDAVTAERLHQQIVLVDMSRGGSVKAVCDARSDTVRYVAAPDSTGVSDSRNRAVANVGTRYALFLDADAIPQPGWAHAMRGAFEEVDRVAVVGARCAARWTDPPPRLFQAPVAGDFLSLFDLGDAPLDVPRIMGTSYAIDLDRVPSAPFPTDVGLSPESRLGGEENVLCERARADGWRVRYEPRANVLHTIRPGRATWRSMLVRAFRAGQEGRREGSRAEPLPRRLTAADRAFQAAIAPAFLAGLLVGPPDSR